VFYSFVLLVAVPLAFCHVMTRGVRQPTDPVAPGYEELRLTSEGLRLRAWLHTAAAPAERPAVVVVHGLGDCLESYADVADTFVRRGHSAILLDLRTHGASEGRVMTMGAHEREDVRAAMALLRSRGLAAHGMIVMGWSMGAVAALRAAAGQADVRAVVAECPFDTYRDTIARHAWLLYRLPRWFPPVPIAVTFAGLWGGFDPDDVDSLAAARALQAPLFLIVDGADDRMPEAVVRRIYDAHPGPKDIWVAPGAPHVGARLRADYWPRVLGFLERHGL